MALAKAAKAPAVSLQNLLDSVIIVINVPMISMLGIIIISFFFCNFSFVFFMKDISEEEK
jgi:hypothetical protein